MFEPSYLPQEKRIYRVAVAQWAEPDGVAQDICEALKDLGHTAVPFLYSDRIPPDCDVVLTFAPWGRFLPLARGVGSIPWLIVPRCCTGIWKTRPISASVANAQEHGDLSIVGGQPARSRQLSGPCAGAARPAARVIDARMIKVPLPG